MTDKEFKSVDKSVLLSGAKSSAINANRLYSSAIEVGKMGNYGIANSLLILSVEESMKAFVLISGWADVDIPFDIRKIFRDHKTKHIQAAEIEPLVRGASLIVNAFSKAKSIGRSRWGTAIEGFLRILLDSRDLAKRKFEIWWNGANDQKKNGLYVDFSNGDWISPLVITIEDFDETRRITAPFIKCAQWIMKLEDDDFELLPRLNK